MTTDTRAQLVALAKKWQGHTGVNWETTSDEALISLASDAVQYDADKIMKLERALLTIAGMRVGRATGAHQALLMKDIAKAAL